MRTLVENKCFDEERSLYALKAADVVNCVFSGPADGESVLKEARDVALKNCDFSLRYPLWHVQGFRLDNCKMDDKTRAAIWYAVDGEIENSILGGIKAVRECSGIHIRGSEILSQEFGWKSSDITMEDSRMIVPAFLMKDQPRSHIERRTFVTVGQ
jgi:hypothetical protein